jgi:hypothetical protein
MVFDVQRYLHPRHLRQHEDRGRDDLRRQRASLQSPLPADVQPLSGRSGRLHASVRLGEGAGREPGRAGSRALLHAAATVQKPRRVKRLAARQMHRLRQGSSPPGAGRSDDLGSVRSRTPQTRSLCRPLRRLPCGDGVGLEDLSRALRQQQVLGRSQRGRASGRGSSLCRSHRDPSGWAHRCRAPAIL